MGASFSRAQAMNAKNNASTAILRSALTNYINATKNMNANKIRAALNNKKIGLKESYKNRIANAVANAVIKARKANVAVAAANLGAASETVAAVHVNNAAKQINNLKNKVEGSSGAASVPQPKGLGGAFFGVKRGNNQNNSTKNVNRNYVLAILKNNAKYQNNKSKINAIIAYNPGLNFLKLARNNNNAKIKNLLAQANSIKKFKQGPAQRLNNTLKANNTLTGNMFKQANANAAKAALKSTKGQVGGVTRNVYYVNGNSNRYIKNTNGKYIKLSNGNVNLGTWPAPNANARKVNFDPENGFIQTSQTA